MPHTLPEDLFTSCGPSFAIWCDAAVDGVVGSRGAREVFVVDSRSENTLGRRTFVAKRIPVRAMLAKRWEGFAVC